MENPEVFIYLLLIVLYFIFNYGINKMMGDKKKTGEQQPKDPGEPYDPWDPFGDEAREESEEEKYGPFREERSDPDLKPEERGDLGEQSTLEPEQQATFPGSDEPTPERRIRMEKEEGKLSSPDQRDQGEMSDQQRKMQEMSRQYDPDDTSQGRSRTAERDTEPMQRRPAKKKKRKKFAFDPRKAVIYSEILNRPKY